MAIITLNNNSLSSVTSLPAGVGGKVLQVVQTSFTEILTSSNTFADLGSLNITPSSTSNKIFITTTNHIYIDNQSSVSGWEGALINIKRGSTSILSDPNSGYGEANNFSTASNRTMCYSTLQYLDSPNTTSATTYTVQYASHTSGAELRINSGFFGSQGTLTLMEVSAWF